MSMETNPYESSEAVLGAQERQVRESAVADAVLTTANFDTRT
jgi:hypothetical protein